jgi:hypothetical protein
MGSCSTIQVPWAVEDWEEDKGAGFVVAEYLGNLFYHSVGHSQVLPGFWHMRRTAWTESSLSIRLREFVMDSDFQFLTT